MANLVRRWWMFNAEEKDMMRFALSLRHHKNVPLALVPFYDSDDVQTSVVLYQMMFALPDTSGVEVLKCKLSVLPLFRLLTYYLMRI